MYLNVKNIFNRLKLEAKLDSYVNLYKELDLNTGSVNSAIRRNSISGTLLEKIIEFCDKYKIDLNYVFLDKDEPKKANLIQTLNTIQNEIKELKREMRV